MTAATIRCPDCGAETERQADGSELCPPCLRVELGGWVREGTGGNCEGWVFRPGGRTDGVELLATVAEEASVPEVGEDVTLSLWTAGRDLVGLLYPSWAEFSGKRAGEWVWDMVNRFVGVGTLVHCDGCRCEVPIGSLELTPCETALVCPGCEMAATGRC